MIFSGQVIFALGGLLDTYPLMQIGRFVFGIGGESLAVAQNTYAVSWFKGKELNMVFGFQVHDQNCHLKNWVDVIFTYFHIFSLVLPELEAR